MSPLTQFLIVLLVLVIVGGVALRFGRMSRAQMQGYRFGRDVIVRCRDGHLFMTTWIPGMSLKAIRLGLVRIQHCPVGNHVIAVQLMRDEDLTPAERVEASHYRDNGVP